MISPAAWRSRGWERWPGRCFCLPHPEQQQHVQGHVIPIAGADPRGERAPGRAAQAGLRAGAQAGGGGEHRAGAGGESHPQRRATESGHATNHRGQGQVGERICFLYTIVTNLVLFIWLFDTKTICKNQFVLNQKLHQSCFN